MAGMSISGLRRIRSEEKGWDNVSDMDYYICFVEEECSVYIIYIRPLHYVKQITFKVVLNENYPFRKPGMVYSMNLDNWREMKNFYMLRDRDMVERFQSVTGLNCMCCVSILCGDNWKVQTKMKDLASEIELFMRIKERMYERLLIGMIERRDNKLAEEIWKYIKEYI